jgi:hypothetical protein
VRLMGWPLLHLTLRVFCGLLVVRPALADGVL